MKRLALALAIGFVACTNQTPAASVSPASASTGALLVRGSIDVAGSTRTYVFFRTPTIDTDRPAPLIVFLHPCDQSNHVDGYAAATTSHFDDQATADKFLVAYPDGQSYCWNAGSCCTHADDVAFIGALITYLETKYPVDKKRVFVAGFSFGAAMTYRVACELATQVAAIAAVSGAMVVSDCHPSRPLSVFVMHGTADDAFPASGGGDYNVPPVGTTIQHWARLDGCSGNGQQFRTGITTTTIWDSCQAGSVVRLDLIAGSPHNWFGLEPDAPPGEPSSSAAVWDFFSRLSASPS